MFGTIASGSVVVNGNVGVPSGTNPNTVLTNANSITTQNTAIGPFSLVGASYSANGFVADDNSSVNLALVLGITIPLAVIAIVVTVVIVIKVRAKPTQVMEGEQPVKMTSPNDMMEPAPEVNVNNNFESIQEENTANNLRGENKTELKATNHETCS